MDVHKFRVGQTVQFRPPSTFGIVLPPGGFKIEQLLPPDAAGNQYRVESVFDGHKRVVRESEISK